jgi:hypothetical protein
MDWRRSQACGSCLLRAPRSCCAVRRRSLTLPGSCRSVAAGVQPRQPLYDRVALRSVSSSTVGAGADRFPRGGGAGTRTRQVSAPQRRLVVSLCRVCSISLVIISISCLSFFSLAKADDSCFPIPCSLRAAFVMQRRQRPLTWSIVHVRVTRKQCRSSRLPDRTVALLSRRGTAFCCHRLRRARPLQVRPLYPRACCCTLLVRYPSWSFEFIVLLPACRQSACAPVFSIDDAALMVVCPRSGSRDDGTQLQLRLSVFFDACRALLQFRRSGQLPNGSHSLPVATPPTATTVQLTCQCLLTQEMTVVCGSSVSCSLLQQLH